MEHSELGDWLRLLGTPEIGNDSARRLLTAFGTPQAVFAQDAAALALVVNARQLRHLSEPPPGHAALLEKTWQWLQGKPEQRRVLVPGQDDYPAALLHMADPPLLLYAVGDFARWPAFAAAADGGRSLAVVGSRNPTPQGLAHARQFARGAAAAGWTIVSGLALGVDGAAHEGALEGMAGDHRQPATVAVVGTGLDSVYPKVHLALAHAIAARGMLLSEYPLGTPPLAANFPRRNRLIAGLSRGTLVVEAALRSGSLITARLAAEQGKEVFAVPGSIYAPQARGCHQLIQQGAKLVTQIEDVLEEFGPCGAAAAAPARAPAEAPPDDDVLAHIGFDPMGLDALAARTGLPTAVLQARLLDLELDGHIVRLPGALFQRFAAA
ncbi:DNA-processing protein DprA [Pseudorhodoferax sp. Leaf274]|uniref:DNA-processing protein DprA n=1 Tax=Pseudorhodoferax sp. Leaf274 TaxID=1736318 RepID=UPI00070295EA|nr:DNA-processing protein DprA [Pseudorhodoferax sp. Leaf274]KQP49745.1 DNA processing protein DprA [Pseudorhodoferax sp. Leaf274]